VNGAQAQSDAPHPAGAPLTITEQELFERLGWFTHVRWFMAAGTLALLAFCWVVLGIRFRRDDGTSVLAPAVYVTLLIFVYNAVFTFLVHVVQTRGQITRRVMVLLALGQIVCDTTAVAALVHFTGGVENYFIILVLLPLVIASELLPQSLAYASAGLASLLFNLMAWGEYPFAGRRGMLEHIHVVLGSHRSSVPAVLHADWVYVLQVTASLSIMSFMMVFIASAISNQLRLREAELEDAYRRLHQADEAKSFFMRKAGHEMRAPLAAIQSILGAVALDAAPRLSDEHRRLMDRARKRSQSLMELVNDLRRYSRLRSAPDDEFQVSTLALRELAANIVELFAGQAREADLDLSLRAESASVRGSDELLRQLLINLVANAVQYTPPGGRVEVSVRPDGEQVVLAVADTGIGISQEARGKLFTEFYRAPEAKQAFADGTGLGLAICKRIVDMHRGTIAAEPREGGGTVFLVRLPRAKG